MKPFSGQLQSLKSALLYSPPSHEFSVENSSSIEMQEKFTAKQYKTQQQ
jgi:hypothetical protein